MKQRVFLTTAAAALLLAACGGGDAPESGAGSAAQETSAAAGGDAAAVPAVFAEAPLPEGTGQDLLDSLAAMEGAEQTESGLVLLTLEEGSGAQPDGDDLASSFQGNPS